MYTQEDTEMVPGSWSMIGNKIHMGGQWEFSSMDKIDTIGHTGKMGDIEENGRYKKIIDGIQMSRRKVIWGYGGDDDGGERV